ncbi:MAG: hypothetical protein CMF48_07650 [Legionellales bacterium]|nr:hypothetical protein [Legionellales bacterium]
MTISETPFSQADLPFGTSLQLSIPSSDDCRAFIKAATESVSFHHPWIKAPQDEATFQNYINNIDFERQISFLLKKRDDGAIVGVINVSEIVRGVFQSAYLGFYAFAGHERQGYMSEGLSLVCRYCFDTLMLHRLEANIQPDNQRSLGLIQKLGFKKEGFSPRYLFINNEWRDHERYAITAEDYNAL